MKCNCGHKLMCKDTREKDNIRYRRYICEFCGEQTFTEEQPSNPFIVKSMLTMIANDSRLPAIHSGREQEELNAIIHDRF